MGSGGSVQSKYNEALAAHGQEKADVHLLESLEAVRPLAGV
jgi:hypothetical protein